VGHGLSRIRQKAFVTDRLARADRDHHEGAKESRQINEERRVVKRLPCPSPHRGMWIEKFHSPAFPAYFAIFPPLLSTGFGIMGKSSYHK
jgi:hypothetical protein